MRDWMRKYWPPTQVCGAAFAVLATLRFYPPLFQWAGLDTPTGRLLLGLAVLLLFIATVVGARNDNRDRAEIKKQVTDISDDVKAIRLALNQLKRDSAADKPIVKVIDEKIHDTENAVIKLGSLLKLRGVGTVTPARLKGAKLSVDPSERDK
jgi:hypothetical protein